MRGADHAARLGRRVRGPARLPCTCGKLREPRIIGGMLDRATIESGVRSFLDRHPAGVVAAYLFGSVAREDARDTSDVDLAMLFGQDPPRTLDGLGLDLTDELQAELGVPVQIVVLNTAPCDLIRRVLRDGRLLVDRDPSSRIRFEVRSRNEYFDLKPFLDRYRRTGPERPVPR